MPPRRADEYQDDNGYTLDFPNVERCLRVERTNTGTVSRHQASMGAGREMPPRRADEYPSSRNSMVVIRSSGREMPPRRADEYYNLISFTGLKTTKKSRDASASSGRIHLRLLGQPFRILCREMPLRRADEYTLRGW